MKNLRILLLATVATGGVLAAFASGAGPLVRLSNTTATTGANAPLVLVDDDEDEDEGGYLSWRKSGHGHDRHDDDDEDEDGEDDDEDEDDDDDGQRRGGQNNPGRVGTMPPPKNGLILEGSAPQVQVN